MGQLRMYLFDDEEEHEEDEPEAAAATPVLTSHGALMDYVRDFRRRKGLPEEGEPAA